MKKSVVAIAALAALSLSAPSWAATAASPAKAAPKKAAKMVKKHHASARVKAVQEALNKHGAKLKADGMWGPKTHMALAAFQKKSGLKATGRLNKATDKKLGLAK